MPVPWLVQRPDVIPIDLGRQLFVDDFLVESCNMERVHHKPEPYAGNPVLEAGTEHEKAVQPRVGLQQGGVFYNPIEKRYEMFYHSGTLDPRHRHLAYSQDMIHWERPDFGEGYGNRFREPGPNGEKLSPDEAGAVFAVWYDHFATDPEQRYKLFSYFRGNPKPHTHGLFTSQDGVHWSRPVLAGPANDAQTFFYNPFRDVWVFSIKRTLERNGIKSRARWYVESPDFLSGANWEDAVFWTGADDLDVPEPVDGYPAYPVPGEPCQLYALHGVAYESIMLGMHEIHRGPENPVCQDGRFPKLTDLELGYSRDGFHWHRPDRSGFIRGQRHDGAWDRAYLHSTTSILLIHEDRLLFPFSGYSGVEPDGAQRGIYSGGAIGLAELRRDGFVSLRAGNESRTLLTRPVRFSGQYLFVNVCNPSGSLTVEVTDRDGCILPGLGAPECKTLTGDHTRLAVRWKDHVDLKALSGATVRFRFHLQNGDLYAFWVSNSPNGESGGFLAGGGSGYQDIRDY